jgi:ribonuclease VapC
MVVDTSAVTAILLAEVDAGTVAAIFRRTDAKRMSAGNFLEFQIIAARRAPALSTAVARELVDRLDIDVVPVTREHAEIPASAYERYGKGRHPAALNFGDCFAYALAKALDAPLLFKGTDFAQTDVEAVAVGAA